MIFTPVRFMAKTPANDLAPFSVRVPGKFTGMNDAASGRMFREVHLWCDTPDIGDHVKDIRLSDDDGVIPEDLREGLPFYPDVMRFYDETDIDNPNGFWISSEKTVVRPFTSQGDPDILLMPGDLYFKGTFVSTRPSPSKTFRGTIIWARYIASSG